MNRTYNRENLNNNVSYAATVNIGLHCIKLGLLKLTPTLQLTIQYPSLLQCYKTTFTVDGKSLPMIAISVFLFMVHVLLYFFKATCIGSTKCHNLFVRAPLLQCMPTITILVMTSANVTK